MHPLHNIHKILIFRLTLFLAVGIFLSDWLLRGYNLIAYHLVAVVALTMILIVLNVKRYNLPHSTFGVVTAICVILFGSLLAQIKWHHNNYSWSSESRVYRGVIIETPTYNDNTAKLTLAVNQCNVYLYISDDSLSEKLKRGDELLFYGEIESPHNMGNPYEFDYASYHLHHDIAGTSFVSPGYWKIMAHNQTSGIKQKALDFRDKILDIYKSWNLDDDALSLMSALTIGEKRLLSEEMKESYRNAGISHVLTLSGMHTAIVWGILSLMLCFMDKNRYLKILKWILITLFLWFFAFLTGLSPTIIRAVIMCMLAGMLGFSFEKRNPLNIICIAAFFILLYNPFYLFDIGFQLSFVAVISIILFYRLISGIFVIKNKIMKRVWDIMSISIAAQIGTAPLIIYYFSNFSVYFLFSNVVASIFTPVIMCGVILFLVFYPFGIINGLIIKFLSICIYLLNATTNVTSSLPGSVINYYGLTFFDVMLLYTILILFFLYIFNKRRNYSLAFTALLSIFVFVKLFTTYNHNVEPQAIVYNNYNSKGLHFIENNKRSYFVSSKKEKLSDSFSKLIANYCNRENLEKPIEIDEYDDNLIKAEHGLVEWHGKRFCILDDNLWRNRCVIAPLKIDYLMINRGFTGRIKSLIELFDIKTIILGSSLSSSSLVRYKKECKELGFEYISIKDEGCKRILL